MSALDTVQGAAPWRTRRVLDWRSTRVAERSPMVRTMALTRSRASCRPASSAALPRPTPSLTVRA
jgi:hypothetical protein